MATVQAAMRLFDDMPPALRSMNSSINTVISSLEALQNASGNALDTANLEAARQELARVGAVINHVEGSLSNATEEQINFNNSVSAATKLLSGLATMAGKAIPSPQEVLTLSDEMTQSNARLQGMNDGQQSTSELKQKVFDAALGSNSSYAQTENTALAMNATGAFASNDESIRFTELLNKQFKIAGTNIDGVQDSTQILTNALNNGVILGEELNSVFSQAPNIVQTMADYMGLSTDEIRNMAAEGQISADIIKYSMFGATDQINDRFASMPVTFGDIWTRFKTEALDSFTPVLEKLNEIANSERFQGFVNSMIGLVDTVAAVIGNVLDIVLSVGAVIYDNWDFIAPLFMFITGAVAAFIMAFGVIPIVMEVVSAAIAIFSGTLLASPLFWIPALIIGIIALFYYLVAVINEFAGTSLSATGMIAGAFMVLGTAIYNQVAFWWNIFAAIAEFFVNVWQHPIYSVKRLFGQLVVNVIDMMIAMSSGWDGFATSFANAIISAVNIAITAWNSFIDLLPDKVVTAVGLGKGTELKPTKSITSDLSHLKKGMDAWIGEPPEDYWKAPKMDLKPLAGAWDKGYNFGENLFTKSRAEEKDAKNQENVSKFEPMGLGKDVNDAINTAGGNSGKTAENTAKMANSLETSTEDLKYLRDLAEQEVINRFTTAEITVDMSGMSNNINHEMDIDGIVKQLEEKVQESMYVTAEGVHM